MHIYSDIDGIITPEYKLWSESYNSSGWANAGLETISKFYSDHDSYIIEKIRHKLTFISGDSKVNKQWAAYRQVPIIICPPYMDKWDVLIKEIYRYSLLNPMKFAYIGDSMPDLECLLKADYAFVPANCSKLLLRKLKYSNKQIGKNLILLESKGGEGCLEECVLWLMDHGHLSEDISL